MADEDSVNNYPLNGVQDRVDTNDQDISQNQSDIQGNTEDITDLEQGLVPVAGITAWDKNLHSTLPDRFVECNGQTVSDTESPMDGETVPELNEKTKMVKKKP